MHILTRISSLLCFTVIFWAPWQQQRQYYYSSSSPQQALFRATLFLFRANLFFFRVTRALSGVNYKEKGCKVENYYILLFLRKKLLNSTLLSVFKFGWSIAMILYIGRKHEFQIAHIPIWTSVLDVDMKSFTSARFTYPLSSPVPHHGEGLYIYIFIYLLSMLHYKGIILHAYYTCCRGCSDQCDQCIPFTFAFTLFWVSIVSVINVGYQMGLNWRKFWMIYNACWLDFFTGWPVSWFRDGYP